MTNLDTEKLNRIRRMHETTWGTTIARFRTPIASPA
jgi:hypothetical protein